MQNDEKDKLELINKTAYDQIMDDPTNKNLVGYCLHAMECTLPKPGGNPIPYFVSLIDQGIVDPWQIDNILKRKITCPVVQDYYHAKEDTRRPIFLHTIS